MILSYTKKFSNTEVKIVEEMINNIRIDPVMQMKGINDLKNKIDFLDISDKYKDYFYQLGRYEQGNNLIYVK